MLASEVLCVAFTHYPVLMLQMVHHNIYIGNESLGAEVEWREFLIEPQYQGPQCEEAKAAQNNMNIIYVHNESP